MPLRRSSASTLSALADEELMQLVRRGEPRAFGVLYDRHAGVAFSLAYRMVGTRAVAEDVVQEAFLALWRANARHDRARGPGGAGGPRLVPNPAVRALRPAPGPHPPPRTDEGPAGR